MWTLRTLRKAIATTGLATLVATAAATAQTPAANDYKPLHRIGTSTALARHPLPTAASLQRMAATPGMADDIRMVLRQSGVPEIADGVITALFAANTSVRGGSCADSTPEDGTIVECDFQPGATLEWMAHRPNALKGNRAPGRLERMRWAGTQSFPAFLFTVTNNRKVYTFMLPKVCGNLSLMSVRDLGPVAGVRVEPPRGPEVAAVSPPPPLPAPPARAAVAEPAPSARGAVAEPVPSARGAVAEPAPSAQGAVSEPAPRAVAAPAAAQAPSGVGVARTPFFFDVLIGKERRVRPPDLDNARLTDWAQCSPLLGLKIGVAKRFDNDWEVAGAGGVAISLVTDDDKVKQSEVLVDAELNKYVGGGAFLGTGLSLWDITRKDTFTPAWMFHFGIPFGAHPVYFLGEGRLFFDHIDDVANNYQVWGGVRVHF